MDGDKVGLIVGTVGYKEGLGVGLVGTAEGTMVGVIVGNEVGANVGE